jgi:hypothetical protein
MALLALFLKDGCNVFGEGDGAVAAQVGCERRNRDRQQNEEVLHGSLLYLA